MTARLSQCSLAILGRSLACGLLCALALVALAAALPAQSRIRVRALLPAPTSPTQRAVVLEAGTAQSIVAVFDAALFPLGQQSTLSPFRFVGASVPGSVVWYFIYKYIFSI